MLALASTCSQEWKHEPVAHSCLPLPCQNPLCLLLCFGLAEDIKLKTLTEGAELLVPSVSWAQFSPDLLVLSLPRQLWLSQRTLILGRVGKTLGCFLGRQCCQKLGPQLWMEHPCRGSTKGPQGRQQLIATHARGTHAWPLPLLQPAPRKVEVVPSQAWPCSSASTPYPTMSEKTSNRFRALG